ncbi:MAG TPA: DNA repair protein RecO [Oscillatoriales cyanobacterium M59_W2019_021]|nr:DNA repair protein RecO [Oscillatoriales cyanobacterium M4454_W2019_049]HIK51551.1 DNA repair protein RecO [Oscillatoriales cyanobacterium M59_W2019_021]
MSRTYKTIGINLKSMPLGEHDRLLTVLTREYGLIQAVAPGSRKHKSQLAGRSALFAINELSMSKGKTLDRITQAETIASYPGLSRNLGTLTASQYLTELVLAQALSEQPQEELFELLVEHLSRLEKLNRSASPVLVLAHLNHGIFHLLASAGLAPQVRDCCVTQRAIVPDITDPNWRVSFKIDAGGTVSTPEESQLHVARETGGHYRTDRSPTLPPIYLNATELTLLQQLTLAELPPLPEPMATSPAIDRAWVAIERILRQYAQYHFGRSIRSATLIDTYLATQAV